MNKFLLKWKSLWSRKWQQQIDEWNIPKKSSFSKIRIEVFFALCFYERHEWKIYTLNEPLLRTNTTKIKVVLFLKCQ